MLLNRIELFLTVAKHKSLENTARAMHVSASSVCQRLKLLETDFGVTLYKKCQGGIELTGAGHTLLATGTDILSQLDTLRKTLNRDAQVAIQSLTVGGTYNPSAKHLPSAIAEFQKTHPNVKVYFLTSTRERIEKLVRESEVDVAIIQNISESGELYKEQFAVDDLTFFAHSTHPLSKKKKLELTDLAQTPVVIREGRGATHQLLKQLKGLGVTLNIVLRCQFPDAVNAAVRRKMGIGISFLNLIEEDVQRKDFKCLKFSGLPELVGTSYIVHSKKKPLSPAASDFLNLLRSMKETTVKSPEESLELKMTDVLDHSPSMSTAHLNDL
jgi:DNA-binding transcriptional LysR family regulator